jgi:hypothetical protein
MTFNLSDRITIAVWSWALNYICIIMCIGIWKLVLITLLLRYHVHHKLMLITVSITTFYICYLQWFPANACPTYLKC